MVAVNRSSWGKAFPGHCDEAVLKGLLDESLAADLQAVAEDHLAACTSCRDRLETLAAAPALWTETRRIYEADESTRHATALNFGSAVQQGRSDDSITSWLRAIAQPCQEDASGSLGHIDRYRIDSVIGSGGMGVVAAGFDEQLARPIAIKLLAPHLAGLAPARRRFAREARAAAAIVHPAIMPIYSVSEQSHPPYLVMPLVGSATAGRSLQQRIDREGPLDLETALGIAAQVAEGLAAAHERGVVHRDIKPGNILMEENSPRVLIGDFGLARAIDDATVTVSGMVAGTPQYMSPEQAAGEAVGPGSDLFSLGSVLYAMLTGRPPFVADSPIAVLRKVIDTPVQPVVSRVESLPPWVDRLVRLFLVKDANARIVSAAEAAQLLRETEAHVRNPSRYPLPARLGPPHRLKTKSTITAMIAAIVLVMVGASLPLLRQQTPQGSNDKSKPGVASPKTLPTGQTSAGPSVTAMERSAAPTETDVSWHWDALPVELQQIRDSLHELERDLNLDAVGFESIDDRRHRGQPASGTATQ
ncbi:Serine/threonine-protein kinase PknB [Stieleria maiorica]|uniref:non-specific serine/threonine protein kinase n=1 Tax=Stieleria maiorica TaxID=2795974 RepID=A0A5B9MQS5_9BACT|nr:serine/threonine-protein kinase [Stieleria maiorica]QEG02215.1 Serine/threonine-protein kinase PknB [Stieleria maiorica]